MVFIFDENFSYRLAHGINALEEGNINQGTPCTVYHIKDLAKQLDVSPKNGKSYTDEEVIEIAGQVKGTIITQDEDFRSIKHYYQLYKEHKVGVVFFKTYKTSKGYWNTVSYIIKHWNNMKAKVESAHKPFAFLVDSKGIQPMNF